MPLENILYLAFVLAAFTQFAVVLTYAEWVTRHANDPVRSPSQFTPEKGVRHDDSNLMRKAA
jgi:hypothetical protein